MVCAAGKCDDTDGRTNDDAQEVFVTGTFDNWSRTVKLEKHPQSGVLQKQVSLPLTDKVIYKVR